MNKLKRIDEFKAILADYQPSDAVKQALQPMRLVLLVAPTSGGRNAIINRLVKTGRYHYIVSDTTRERRINNGVPEQDGREYWFRTEEELLQDLRKGEFLEAAIIHRQQVSGISIRELNVAQQENKTAISEIEIVGAENIYSVKPNASFIFIIPPSFEEWMHRMRKRGELPDDEVRRRLESASNEFAAALAHNYYKIVINDNLADATERVDNVVKSGTQNAEEQTRARQLVEQLYEATQAYLH